MLSSWASAYGVYPAIFSTFRLSKAVLWKSVPSLTRPSDSGVGSSYVLTALPSMYVVIVAPFASTARR
ncbi:hypothetical protein ACFC96_35220 [Streptomyces sp. NPDC055955]|uniref:hypothetical protein n=1 Tax=Streptomyces sp. NPDC055955 TaxID=3345665 RepID=UPI0035DF0F16